MQQIGNYLVKRGHGKIAALSGYVEYNERAPARLEGILDTMDLSGRRLRSENIIYGEFSVEFGREGLRLALALHPRRTALICSTDLVAAEALSQAVDLDLKVPAGFSVTGFNNIIYAGLLTPWLTTGGCAYRG